MVDHVPQFAVRHGDREGDVVKPGIYVVHRKLTWRRTRNGDVVPHAGGVSIERCASKRIAHKWAMDYIPAACACVVSVKHDTGSKP